MGFRPAENCICRLNAIGNEYSVSSLMQKDANAMEIYVNGDLIGCVYMR